jgi:hypothetical protein
MAGDRNRVDGARVSPMRAGYEAGRTRPRSLTPSLQMPQVTGVSDGKAGESPRRPLSKSVQNIPIQPASPRDETAATTKMTRLYGRASHRTTLRKTQIVLTRNEGADC